MLYHLFQQVYTTLQSKPPLFHNRCYHSGGLQAVQLHPQTKLLSEAARTSASCFMYDVNFSVRTARDWYTSEVAMRTTCSLASSLSSELVDGLSSGCARLCSARETPWTRSGFKKGCCTGAVKRRPLLQQGAPRPNTACSRLHNELMKTP